LIAEMLDKRVDILMEQLGGRRQSIDFRRGSSLGKLGHIVEITKPASKPDWSDQVGLMNYQIQSPVESSERRVKSW
jgi:hypothetical protein